MSPWRSLAAVGLVAVVALVGCAGPGALDASEAPEPSPSASPEPSASEPAASEEPEGIDTSGWAEYATHDGDMAYRFPADWTLESRSSFFSPDADRDDVADPYERWMDESSLTAPNGQMLLVAYDFVDLGGACGGPEMLQPVEVLATEPLDGSSDVLIATLAIGTVDGRWMFGMGLSSGVIPTEDTCVVHFATGTSDGGVLFGTTPSIASTGDDALWTVDTLDDATAYMQTVEYATLLEILRSVVLT